MVQGFDFLGARVSWSRWLFHRPPQHMVWSSTPVTLGHAAVAWMSSVLLRPLVVCAKGVVVAVASGPDGGLDPGTGQAPGVTRGHILVATIAVMGQALEGVVLRGDEGMLEGFQANVLVVIVERVDQPAVRRQNASVTKAVQASSRGGTRTGGAGDPQLVRGIGCDCVGSRPAVGQQQVQGSWCGAGVRAPARQGLLRASPGRIWLPTDLPARSTHRCNVPHDTPNFGAMPRTARH